MARTFEIPKPQTEILHEAEWRIRVATDFAMCSHLDPIPAILQSLNADIILDSRHLHNKKSETQRGTNGF